MSHVIFHSTTLSLAAVVALGAGCASSGPSPQLIDARLTQAQAEHSKAASLAPDDVIASGRLLYVAEAQEDGSGKEQHYAYLAQRRAQMAMSRAESVDASQKKDAARQAKQSLLEQQAAAAERELEAERLARAEAEARYAALQAFALIRQEERGTVITLSGSVLFESDEDDLMSIATQRLDQVAAALEAQENGGTIVIEGHTDSEGSDAYNQALAQARAEAVRAYLVSRGVDPHRVSAVGVGESRPVADNASAEGRANNRRVEVVISPVASR